MRHRGADYSYLAIDPPVIYKCTFHFCHRGLINLLERSRCYNVMDMEKGRRAKDKVLVVSKTSSSSSCFLHFSQPSAGPGNICLLDVPQRRLLPDARFHGRLGILGFLYSTLVGWVPPLLKSEEAEPARKKTATTTAKHRCDDYDVRDGSFA